MRENKLEANGRLRIITITSGYINDFAYQLNYALDVNEEYQALSVEYCNVKQKFEGVEEYVYQALVLVRELE